MNYSYLPPTPGSSVIHSLTWHCDSKFNDGPGDSIKSPTQCKGTQQWLLLAKGLLNNLNISLAISESVWYIVYHIFELNVVVVVTWRDSWIKVKQEFTTLWPFWYQSEGFSNRVVHFCHIRVHIPLNITASLSPSGSQAMERTQPPKITDSSSSSQVYDVKSAHLTASRAPFAMDVLLAPSP